MPFKVWNSTTGKHIVKKHWSANSQFQSKIDRRQFLVKDQVIMLSIFYHMAYAQCRRLGGHAYIGWYVNCQPSEQVFYRNIFGILIDASSAGQRGQHPLHFVRGIVLNDQSLVLHSSKLKAFAIYGLIHHEI